MSWVLRSSGKNEFFLLPTSVCRVGRQGCQILIPDTTVSRHHADIEVNAQGVTLKDVSKFVQTSVNGKLLTTENRVVTLVDKDVITFGAYSETYTLEHRPFILACSDDDQLESLQKLAESVVISLTSDLESDSVSGLVVTEKVEHTNNKIIKALLTGIPLVAQSFLVAMSHCHSGCTSLPPLQDHVIPLANPKGSRANVLRGKRFLLFGFFSKFDSDVISTAGGSIIESIGRTMDDIYIVDESSTQPMFEHRVTNARICSMDLVRRVIVEGLPSRLEQLTPEDIQPRRQEVAQAATGWLSTQTKADHSFVELAKQAVHPNCSSDASTLQPAKKFKKSRIVDSGAEVVPLQDWTNNTSLRQVRDGNLTLKSRADDLDDWMNSTISQ